MLIILLMVQTRAVKVRQFCGYSLDGARGRVCVAHCLFSLSISIGCLSKQTEKRVMTVITCTSKSAQKHTHTHTSGIIRNLAEDRGHISLVNIFNATHRAIILWFAAFVAVELIEWNCYSFSNAHAHTHTHNHVKLHQIPGIGLWVATSPHTPCSSGDIFIAFNST